ncbi:MAG: hypothetical protein AAFO63_09715 [Pseudomonadota bacterium]
MENMIGLAASAAGGGVFGLIGTAIGRVAGFVERRQSYAHEAAKWAHDLRQFELKQAATLAQTQADLDMRTIDGRWQGLEASIQAEAAIAPSYPWVDAIRGLTRPGLTFLLWLISAGIWLGADPDGRAAIIETASFAATAATLWWFGDRGPRQGL